MAFPAAPTESGTAKIHFLTTDGNVAAGWAGIITGVTTTGTNTVGWAGVATHVEGNAVLDPGSLGTLGAAPVVLVAGDDGSFVVPLQLNGSGSLKVDGSGVTQPVSGTVAVTGVATETTLGTRLAEATFTGRINTQGQKTMALSTPVVIASDQTALSSVGPGTETGVLRVTLANNSTGQVAIASGPTGASAVQNQGASASGSAKAGNPQQVGGVFNATQPTVSTGQTVEAQSTARGSLMIAPGVDAMGQVAMAASFPVVIASNQTAVPVSGTVTANAGTGTMAVSVSSSVPGTGATNLGKAVDAVPGGTDTGIATLAVRTDTLGAITPVDGDYTQLRVNSQGALHVTGAGGGTQYVVDAALGATPTGTLAIAMRDDALTALPQAEGDAIPLRVNSTGALHVTGGGGGTQYATSDALGATPTGTVAMARRDDALSALPAIEDDAADLKVDANGALWVKHSGTLTVDGSGVTQPVSGTVTANVGTGTQAVSGTVTANAGSGTLAVSVASLPLPSGAATETTLGTRLAEATFTTRVPVLGQAVMASSVPVVIASNQGALSTNWAGVSPPIGAGTEGAALRVTVATDSTGTLSVDDGGGVLTVDGGTKDAGPNFTPIYKHLIKATTAAATLWDPAGGTQIVITDIIISISGTATDVTLAFGSGTAMTTEALVFYGDVKGGLTAQLRSPIKGGVDNNLNITLSAAQTMAITVCGYEE